MSERPSPGSSAVDDSPVGVAGPAGLRQGSVLEYIIANIPHSIFWKDRDGHFLGGNQNLLRDLGLASLADLIGRTDYDFGFSREQADFFRRCDLEVMARGAPLLDIEETQDQADGTHTLLTSKVPLRDDQGRVIGLLGIYTDITDRKRSEESLRQARDAAEAADRAKSDFLTLISHELRTPLTLILGPLEQLLRPAASPSLTPTTRFDLERMQRNAGRLLALVSDLLEFATIEAGQLRVQWEPVDVIAAVEQLVGDARPAAASRGLSLSLVVDGELARSLGAVPLDQRKFDKIVLNLLGNGIKFTPAGGQVEVALRGLGEGDPGRFELSVRDTGIGIPHDKQGLLFKRFQLLDDLATRKSEGTGIGLALVKELAEAMGGAVGVESEPGRGSRFWVRLARAADVIAPRAPAVLATAPAVPSPWSIVSTAPEVAPAAAATAGVAGPRVLVAEDNPDLRGWIAELLIGAGYEVEAVANGRLALDAVAVRPPLLVLADIMMPELDGYELLRRLKADPARRQIPVILLTAKASRAELVSGLTGGADDYLGKPFSVDELLARVGAAVRMHGLYRELADRHAELARAQAQLRQTEEQLVHSAKVAAVGTLVAGLSHELNNPLSVILMNTQRLLGAPALDPAEQRRALSMIERGTLRCAKLVRGLLDLVRKQPPRREAVNLRALVQRLVDLVQLRATGCGVEIELLAPELLADPAAEPAESNLCVHDIETALLNLLSNAVDASPSAGRVVVTLRSRDRVGRRGCEILVADGGAGIAPDVLPHVFDPFFTTKPPGEGTGLGLALARRIVEAHQGQLGLDSSPAGTTATVWLPSDPAAGDGEAGEP